MDENTRVHRAEARVRIAMFAIGLFAAAAVVLTVLLLLPYSPMTVHSYAPERSEVCPRETIEVFIEYELLAGEMSVTSIEAESAWTAVDVPHITEGQRVGGLSGTLSPPPPGETVEGVLPRIAPPNSGEWRLGSEIEVRGTRYGVPHVQTLQTQATETTKVLPADDSRCAGRGGAN